MPGARRPSIASRCSHSDGGRGRGCMVFAWIAAYWWVLLLESLLLAGLVGLVALAAPRLVASHPTSLARLKASMAVTALAVFLGGIALIVGVSSLLGSYYGYTGIGGGLATVVAVGVALFMAAQWLFSPYIINLVYRTRPPTAAERWVEVELERIARASGVRRPKLRIAPMSAPNAFAYGSPLAGNYVAVTEGLLRMMPREEVVAVLGHEVGHLKHRDVAWILALSLIPVAIYYLGRILLWASLAGAGRRDERGANPLLLIAVGVALIAAGILFKFLIAHFNRLREYYADAHSALTLGNPRPLQRALARIHAAIHASPRIREELTSKEHMAQLFIVAPLVELYGGFYYDVDYMVERLKRAEPSPLEELFSTHPPVPKRLRFLDALALEPRA